MRLLVDENLPPALARALSALFPEKHEIIHLRTKFGPAVKDIEWIKTLGEEGKWIILSSDRRITKNRAENQAFKSSRLIGFFFAAGLQKAKLTKQMERLMAVWETIETQVDLISGGGMFEIQMKGSTLRPL